LNIKNKNGQKRRREKMTPLFEQIEVGRVGNAHLKKLIRELKLDSSSRSCVDWQDYRHRDYGDYRDYDDYGQNSD
jgi:hypothetical protein